MGNRDVVDAFIRAACAPLDASHASGTLDHARSILAEHPEVASATIHTAAILGNDSSVIQFLQVDPASATRKGGPYEWDALTHLCFSRYLRLDRSRSEGFLRAATALLESGADPNTGFWSEDHQPNPALESAIYGAAGVAHHAALTKLLLERGADPNDDETEYHAPEGFDNEAMETIVRSGKLNPIGLATMLHRKLDWTDFDAVAWLLEHGADPNFMSHWGGRALDHALGRDNDIRFFEALLEHGADPRLPARDDVNAIERGARMGRQDVLSLFEKRGFGVQLSGAAAFLAACARGDAGAAADLLAAQPGLREEIDEHDSSVVAHFAGAGNADGVRILLDHGFDVESRSRLAGSRGATALHLAVWRARESTVELLLDRGASIEAQAPNGDTPLALAVRALVEHSEWTPHDSTSILSILLNAGADVSKVRKFPSGSDAADDLLRRFGRR